ncbi:MAG: cell division protein FtsA [Patescibacteria group bacterium]|nr:cell division protein FtsA [Patescibacteria group bacterium]
MSRPFFLFALDIGSNSVKGVCASSDPKTGEIGVLAKAVLPCFGVRNGEIVGPEKVAQTIQSVKNEIVKQTGQKLKETMVNVGGSHIFSMESAGVVSVSRADRKIAPEDVTRVLKAAEAVNLPSNKEVVDVFPRGFVVDGERGIKEPVGLEGIRLEAKVLLACIFSPVLNNLEKAVAAAGLEIAEVVITPLACSQAVLSQEQKELGVILIDIGAGDTSVAVFEKGDLVDFAIFPLGSANITSDIAIGLRTEIATAENLKKEFATLKAGAAKGKSEKIKESAREGHTVEFSRKFLKDIVEARINEIFAESQKAIKKITGGSPMPSGIVLTGGGALLPGIVDFAKQKFKLPCRLGAVQGIKGLVEPDWATAAGLLLAWNEGTENYGGKTAFLQSHRTGFGQKIKGVFKAFLP